MFFIWFISNFILAIDPISVVNVTLTDSEKGLLNGFYDAALTVYDYQTDQIYWSGSDRIYFQDGYSEIKIGPIDTFQDIKVPYLRLKIDRSTLLFPIHPVFFSVHAKVADQLSNLDALRVDGSNVGFGVDTATEKLTINGNIKLIDPSNRIVFSNDTFFDESLLQDIQSSLNANAASLSVISEIIDFSEFDLPQHANGKAMIAVNSSGQLTAISDFNSSDESVKLLVSSNDDFHSPTLSSDFMFVDNQISLADVSMLELTNGDINSIPSDFNGGIMVYNDAYYVWNNEWQQLALLNDIDFSSVNSLAISGDLRLSNVLIDDSVSSILLIDSTGLVHQQSKDTLFSTGDGINYSNGAFSINDSSIISNSLLVWDQGFKSVDLPANSGLDLSNGVLSFSDLFTIDDTVGMGIGIDPTQKLDINGAIRLREHSVDSLLDVGSGTIIFDGADFKGWTGSEWVILSNSDITTINDSSLWTYNSTHLVTMPDHNVGIKVLNPQATLDVSGNIRVRTLPVTSTLSNFIVSNEAGDLYSRSFTLTDFFPTASIESPLIFQTDGSEWELLSLIQPNGDINYSDTNGLSISSMDASVSDFLIYSTDGWIPGTLSTSNMIDLNANHLSLVTHNVSNNDVMFFDGSEWTHGSFFQSSDTIDYDNGLFYLSSQNALIGYQLTWDGSSWVPSKNETISYFGSNGIVLDNQHFRLADNLLWSNNAFTIGHLAAAEFNVNRLSSNLSSPIHITDGSGDSVFKVNASGQLSIGFDSASSYSIASNGFNYFTHSISRYQSSIGTTNIGTTEFGPTVLIQSIESDVISATRSVLEVLDVSANSLFEVQDSGQVGISTAHPQATLDINGYARLKVYNSEPIECDSNRDGSIALNSNYTLCVCKLGVWVESTNDQPACSW